MEKLREHPEQEARELTSSKIGADVVVRGDIEGPTDLHVEGRVLGAVTVVGLVLEEHAEIDGPVKADAVVIGGFVNGSVDAKALHVKASGRIEGDVSYASLQIEPGARLSGRLIVSDGSEPVAAKMGDSPSRPVNARPDAGGSAQELVRMAARLRRVSE